MTGKSVFAAAFLVLASTPVAATEDEDVYDLVRPSMVQLVGIGTDGRYSLGSGVALPNGSVVTSCHVTLRAKRVEPFRGDSSFKAQSQRADVQHDLCTLRFPGLNLHPAVIGESRNLRLGDKVYSVGFNRGRNLTYESGEVAELFEFDGGMVIRTTAAFNQGASGGGLFDSRGRLVGILTFLRVAGGETTYFAVPAEWLEAVARQPSAEVQPLDGVPFWADTLERQPAFLQAGALEAAGLWEELLALARSWTDERPQDGQAWLMLGKAALNTGDRAVAEAALQHAAQFGVTSPTELLVQSQRSTVP